MCYLQINLEICKQSDSNRNSSNVNLPLKKNLSLKLFYSWFTVEKIHQQRNQWLQNWVYIVQLARSWHLAPINYQNLVCSTIHSALSLKYACDFEVAWFFFKKSIRMKWLRIRAKVRSAKTKILIYIFISTDLGRRFFFGTIKLLLKFTFAKYSVWVATDWKFQKKENFHRTHPFLNTTVWIPSQWRERLTEDKLYW